MDDMRSLSEETVLSTVSLFSSFFLFPFLFLNIFPLPRLQLARLQCPTVLPSLPPPDHPLADHRHHLSDKDEKKLPSSPKNNDRPLNGRHSEPVGGNGDVGGDVDLSVVNEVESILVPSPNSLSDLTFSLHLSHSDRERTSNLICKFVI